MRSLKAHLNSLDFSTQLDVAKNLVDNAQAKTTFWGSRIVQVNGFKGSVSLNTIANKIVMASRQRSDADDLTPAERIAGIEIVRKLKDFYQITDTQIKNSNFFTKFLNWIREFSFYPYTTRFMIEESAESRFRGYSKDKFLQQFGGTLDASNFYDHPASDGFCGHPLRLWAKEDRIRALSV